MPGALGSEDARPSRVSSARGHGGGALPIGTLRLNIANLSSANWLNVPCTYATPSTADQVWVDSGSINLSSVLPAGYAGSFVIGFRYTGSGTNGQTTNFRIDDVVIQ